jgi:hypothetical protein
MIILISLVKPSPKGFSAIPVSGKKQAPFLNGTNIVCPSLYNPGHMRELFPA